MPDLDQIKHGEQASARPARGRCLKFAAHRGRSEGRRLPRGPAGGHHRGLKAVEKRCPGLDRVICATLLESTLLG